MLRVVPSTSGLTITCLGGKVEWEFNDKYIVVDGDYMNPFAYYSIIEASCGVFDKCIPIPDSKLGKMPLPKVKKWLIAKFVKLLNHKVYPYWSKYISQMKSTDALLARRLFRADFKKGGRAGFEILRGKTVLTPRQLSEVLQYPLAASFVVKDEAKFLNSADWRTCFALNGQVTSALRETIDNYNQVIPWYKLVDLANVNLVRPVNTKLEIVTAISSHARHRKVALNADVKELKASLGKTKVSLRKTTSICSAVGDITSYDKPHFGNFADLTSKFLKHNKYISPVTLSLIDNDKLLYYPIEIGECEGIIKFKTVGDIRDTIENVLGQKCDERNINTIIHQNNDGMIPLMINNSIVYIKPDETVDVNTYSDWTQEQRNFVENLQEDLTELDL